MLNSYMGLNFEEHFDVSEIIFYSITLSKSYMPTSFYPLKLYIDTLIIEGQFSFILGE